MRNRSKKYVVALSYGLLLIFFFFTAASLTERTKNLLNGLLISHGYSLSNIEVSGNANLTRESVYKIVDQYKNQNIVSVPISRIRKELLKQKWVSRATVIRKIPSTIIILVDEYKPFAILNNSKIVADDFRTLIQADHEEERKFAHLLKINSQNLHRTSLFLETLKTIDEGIFDKLTSIEEISSRRWNLIFKSGTVIKLPEKNLDLALNRLKKILCKNPDLHGLKSIDLRLADKTFFS